MKLIYPAFFYPFEDGEGFLVEFPDLPGCVTQGETLQEALEMAQDAASGWILTSIEEDEKIPSPSRNPQKPEECSFFNYISLDIDDYAKKYSSKAVKKTLTLPQWLNTLAEKEDINFSKVLQNALKVELKLNIEAEKPEDDTNSQEHRKIMNGITDLNKKFNDFNEGIEVAGKIAKCFSQLQVRSEMQ